MEWGGLPHNLRASKPRRGSEAEARARADEDFVEALDRECLVATDGAGETVGSRSERHRAVRAGAAVVTFGRNKTPTHASCLRMKVPGKQTVPRAETWAVLQVLLLMKGEQHMKIVTDAMYVIKGVKMQNRKPHYEGKNGDIWRDVYRQMDRLRIKPTAHKIKSHPTVTETASLLLSNPNTAEWLISNEAADAAAGAYADHLGKFEAELKKEEFNKSQLWKVIKRISSIELHIRNSDDDLGDTAEGFLAKAEAQPANQTEEIETGMKRKIGNLLRVNGHKLRPIADTDTGWVRCAITAGGMSDSYWSSNSCNRNQCISSECWSRK